MAKRYELYRLTLTTCHTSNQFVTHTSFTVISTDCYFSDNLYYLLLARLTRVRFQELLIGSIRLLQECGA